MAAVLRHLSKYVPLCLLFAALLAPSSSCSGSAGRPEAQTPQGNILAASGGPLERLNLPSPAEIERNASVIEAGSVCKGSSFRDDLSHQHVSVDGDDALFDPGFFSGGDPSYSSVAVAIYSLDIGPGLDQLDDMRDINVDGATDLAMGSMHIFAGLPSVSQDHWEWTEMKKKPKPTYTSLNSYSWGVTNSGSMTKRTQGTWLNVCLVIFGDSALHVKRVAITPSNPFDGGVSAVAFRKGWDGKVKGRVSLDGSVHVVGDDAGRLSVSYYDSSASQLYFMELEDRLWTTRHQPSQHD